MTKITEKQFATLLANVDGLNTSVKALSEKVTTLQNTNEDLKDLDLKSVLQEFEQLKAAHEKTVTALRNSRRGLYVPGLEDEGVTKQFSLLRACTAVKNKDWKNASFEQEVIKAARDRLEKLKAAHVIGDDELGGFFVPDQVIADVIAAIYTTSQLISLDGDDGTTRIRVLDNLIGGNVKIPRFLGGLIAYWIGEEDEYAESQTNVGDMKLSPHKLGVLAKLTAEMQTFAGFGFEQMFRTDMVRAAAKKLDYTAMFGRGGDNMPKGIAHTDGIYIYSAQSNDYGVLGTDALGGAKFQADWDGAELGYKGLQAMQLALEENDITPDDSAWWGSHPRFWARLKDLRVPPAASPSAGEERQFVLGLPMISDARLAEAIGNFFKSTQWPTSNVPGATISAPQTGGASKYGDVLYGNLSEVVMGRWAGLQITDDAGRGKGFTSDHAYVKLRLWADFGVRETKALILCPDAKMRD